MCASLSPTPRRRFLRHSLLGVAGSLLGRPLLSAAPRLPTPVDPAAWAQRDVILARLQAPRIPARTLLLTDLGARPDPAQDARPAFLAAFRRLNPLGGGRLIVPPGIWRLDGPLHLTSGIELHLTAGATLRFSPDPARYLPLVLTRWEGVELFNYSPCIYAYQASDVAITGGGTIDGQAAALCVEWRQRQRPDRDRVRQLGATEVPLAERTFGPGHWLRIGLVQFFGCQRVLLEDLTLRNSGFWCAHTVACDQVIVRRLRVEGEHLNNDCFDPESSSDVLVEDCHFRSGDDCIAIKSGRDQDGWRIGRPTQDVVIRRCDLASTGAAALAIGSEMSGGVRRVFVEDCRIREAKQGVNIKGNLDRGGWVEQAHFRRLTAERTEQFVQCTVDYQGYRGGGHPPHFQDFSWHDLHCRDTGTALRLLGTPGTPITRLQVSALRVDRATVPAEYRDVRDVQLTDCTVAGQPLPPPPAPV